MSWIFQSIIVVEKWFCFKLSLVNDSTNEWVNQSKLSSPSSFFEKHHADIFFCEFKDLFRVTRSQWSHGLILNIALFW